MHKVRQHVGCTCVYIEKLKGDRVASTRIPQTCSKRKCWDLSACKL